MKIEVNIDKKYFIVLISLISIFGIVLVTNAYNYDFGSNPNPVDEAQNLGHSADEIAVEFGGTVKSIQEAFEQLDSDNDGIVDNSDDAESVNGWETVEEPPECTGETNALQWDGSHWNCVNIETGDSFDLDLVNGLHSSSQCENMGGDVVSDGSGNDFCRFNQGSCPSGWYAYQDWSTTSKRTCEWDRGYCVYTGRDQPDECGVSRDYYSCTTGSHSWANRGKETCTEEVRECSGSCSMSYPTKTCYASITQIGCY